MIKESVHVVDEAQPQIQPGTAGLRSQIPGMTTTVSGVALNTGGIGAGRLISTAIERKVQHHRKV